MTIAPQHVPSHDERLSLIAWSAVAEPADRVAGALVDAIGAAPALGWLVGATTNLAQAGLDLAALAGPELASACLKASEHWQARLELAALPHEERAAAVGARVVTRVDPDWPHALDDLGAARPFAMYWRGEAEPARLDATAVAVVGARSATAYGGTVAADIAAELAESGVTVISGGAFGIDAAAHRAAIGAGGVTIAVMAGGIDRLYPTAHEDLLRRVMEGGAVVSEVPPGFAPYRSRFLSRNRIIATASATVVVEAAYRSGALSTAAHAATLLRPVGAVPGPVTSASSAGCHALIRDGAAVLVTCADDVRELASGTTAWAAREPEAREGARADARIDFDSPGERALFDATTARPSTMEALAAKAGLTIRDALTAGGALEARGLLSRRDGRWCRVNK